MDTTARRAPEQASDTRIQPSTVAWITLAVNAAVILQGAVVRITGSGAGCGRDWPRCQGEILPLAHGMATWIEYSHRVLSGVALLLGIWLLVTAIRHRATLPALLPFALASGYLLVVEALIGAGTVLTGLTGDNVSIARGLLVAFHLVNSLLLIGALALATFYACPDRPWPPVWTGQKWLVLLMALGLLGMLLLMFSGGIAAMGNTMFPPQTLLGELAEDFSRTAHPLIRLRLLHPVFAIGVGVYLWLVFGLSGWLRPVSQCRQHRRLLLPVYGMQLVVGTANLALLGPVPLQLLHLALAMLSFALWTVVTWATLACADTPAPVRSPETAEVMPV